jgi:hypothetical protein
MLIHLIAAPDERDGLYRLRSLVKMPTGGSALFRAYIYLPPPGKIATSPVA